MRIIYNKKFPVYRLRRIAKLNSLKNTSKLKKNEILNVINIHKNVSYIQREFRKKTMIDKTCPISLEPLKYPFICIKVYNDKFKYYNFKALVDYLKNSRDFRDPITRMDIPDYKIAEINTLMNYYFKGKNTKGLYSKNMEITAEYLTLSTCVNNLFEELNNMETIPINHIYGILIPQLIFYFHSLLNRHRDNCFMLAQQCLDSISHHPCTNKFYIIDYFDLLVTVNELN